MFELTPRENMIRFFSREIPERIPSLRKDVHNFMTPDINERGPAAPDNPMVNEGFDWFGVHWTYVPAVKAPMVSPEYPPVLKDITEWKKVVKFPDLDAIDWKAAAEKELSDPRYDPNKFRMITLGYGCFERLHALMGMEEACCALLEEPEAVYDFFSAVADFKIELMKRLLQAYPVDMFVYSDDWGHQRNLFFSIDTWRSLIKPQMERITAFCDEAGVFLHMHSCGKIEDLIPDVIGAGIKHWTSCQTVNEIEGIIKKYGDRLTLTGGMDVFKYMGKVTPEEMDRIVGERIDRLCKGAALLPFGSSSVPGLSDAVEKAIAERPDFFKKPENRVLPK